MPTSIYGTFLDSESNLLTGSKVTIRPYQPPYYYSGSATYGGPNVNYTDANGYTIFPHVVPGIYRVSWTAANANTPAIYINHDETVIYINVLETSGSSVNLFSYVINSPSGSLNPFNFVSASYAVTASYAVNSSGGSNITSGSTYNITSSWANNSKTASYVTDNTGAIINLQGTQSLFTGDIIARNSLNLTKGLLYYTGSGPFEGFLVVPLPLTASLVYSYVFQDPSDLGIYDSAAANQYPNNAGGNMWNVFSVPTTDIYYYVADGSQQSGDPATFPLYINSNVFLASDTIIASNMTVGGNLIVSGSINGNVNNAITASVVIPSNTTDALISAKNVGIQILYSDGNSFTDPQKATASFAGQLGATWFSGFGGNAYTFYPASSTTPGDWYTRPFAFLNGIQQVGTDPSIGTTPMANISSTIWCLNGSPVGHGATGDSVFSVRNYSTSSNNSGAGFSCCIHSASGVPIPQGDVGCSFLHVPSNRIKSLLPGNAMMVFNTDNVNMKGYSICSPGLSGFDPGNYSIAYYDFINKLFRIPHWLTASFQPSDLGWADSMTVNPVNGLTTINSLIATGSLNGTSSLSISASFVTTSSYAVSSSNALTSSYITASNVKGTVTSASYAVTSSFLNGQQAIINSDNNILTSDGNGNLTAQSYVILGNNLPSGHVSIDNGENMACWAFNVYGAAEFHSTVQFDNTVTGNLTGTSSWASNTLTSSYITASNVKGTVTSASYAVTSSWTANALTSSFITGSNVKGTVISSSYAKVSSTSSYFTDYGNNSIFFNGNGINLSSSLGNSIIGNANRISLTDVNNDSIVLYNNTLTLNDSINDSISLNNGISINATGSNGLTMQAGGDRITLHNGVAVVGNLTLSGNDISGTPTDTTTPTAWMSITINSQVFFIPLYQ